MASSDVQICNYALGLLGDDSITSLTDDSNRARLANRFFADRVEQILRLHPWNCAIERVALAQISTDPVFGWDSQFQLPTNCLFVLSLNDDQERGEPGDPFRVEGRMLLCNSTAADIRYVKSETDPNQYDSLLKRAIGTGLAADMAYGITGSQNVAVLMEQKHQQVIQEARSTDSQEGTPENTDITTLIVVR